MQKCVTALDRTWHCDHFFCAHCGKDFGEEGFHERDGAYGMHSICSKHVPVMCRQGLLSHGLLPNVRAALSRLPAGDSGEFHYGTEHALASGVLRVSGECIIECVRVCARPLGLSILMAELYCIESMSSRTRSFGV